MKVNFLLKHILFGLTLWAVGSTSISAKQSDLDAKVAEMSDCEKLQALVKSHQNDFTRVRGPKSTTKLADIWTAKYHMVGKSCQIFGWGASKLTYTCSMIAPNQAVADERYVKALTKVKSCLGNAWMLQERPRNNGKGTIALFQQANNNTTVAVHSFETSGLFNDEWTTYLYVGDPKK